MDNNRIIKLFEVRVATSLFSADGSPWTNERANLDLEDPKDISVTRKGTVYEAFDYGEPPDDFDIGDEKLYNKWAGLEFEDGELASVVLKKKHGKDPEYLYSNIDQLLSDIAVGYLDIIPDSVNYKEIPSEYLSKIAHALEIRLGDLWGQFFIAERIDTRTEKLQRAVRKSNKDLQKYEATLELYGKIQEESMRIVE